MRPRGVWASPLEPSALVVVGSPAAAEALTLRDSAQQLQGGCGRLRHAFLARAGTPPHTPLREKVFQF